MILDMFLNHTLEMENTNVDPTVMLTFSGGHGFEEDYTSIEPVAVRPAR